MHANVIWKLTGLPRWLSGKESAFNAGNTDDASLIPGSGRSPGGGNSNPLQYPHLENPMDRGDWWVTVHGITESDTTEATDYDIRYYNFHKVGPKDFGYTPCLRSLLVRHRARILPIYITLQLEYTLDLSHQHNGNNWNNSSSSR